MKRANEQTIRALLARYDEGLTTEQEERELRTLLAAADTLPRDLRAATAIFDGFAALGTERLPERIEDRMTIRPSITRQAGWGSRLFGWSGWAVAAVLAVGLFVALDREQAPYCYINGEPIYDLEVALESTSCLACLDQIDRSMELFDELILTTDKTE